MMTMSPTLEELGQEYSAALREYCLDGGDAALLRARQLGRRAVDDEERGFFTGRVSVVLPAWPQRFHQPNFRRFVEETVALACPVHLQAHCVWLGFEPMQRFEAALRAWLDALRAHALGKGDAAALDAASAPLVAILRNEMEAGDAR